MKLYLMGLFLSNVVGFTSNSLFQAYWGIFLVATIFGTIAFFTKDVLSVGDEE